VTYRSWSEAASAIRDACAPGTPHQHALASISGISLPRNLPKNVAAARLRNTLWPHLNTAAPQPPYDSQLEVLHQLATSAGRPVPRCGSRGEAEAWIEHFRLRTRLAALSALRLSAGDLVRRASSPSGEVDEVVSISGTGVVYFKGGHARAWPDDLALVARAGDRSPVAQRAGRSAANRAAHRRKVLAWSLAKATALEPYAVPDAVTEAEIELLRSTIETADDERPIQAVLRQHPALIASLVPGPERYCIPEVSVGNRYKADFFIADANSNGIRWVLIELETPHSYVALKRSNEFDKKARKGISQVHEWRQWFQDNLDQARKLRDDNGLGLLDIRPQADGMVLVGRRQDMLPAARALRQQLWESDRIAMHTYDWLMDQLDGTVHFSGPSAANPYVIPRDSSREWW
jgi:hypothetical protein